MNSANHSPLSRITRRNIYLAILISLSVSAYLVLHQFHPAAFKGLNWSGRLVWFLLLAATSMLIRHLAYMYRIWLVTGKVFSIRQCFELVLMWEFAAVATPSTVGGAAVAMFLLNKEGVNLGKSTASVFLITLLDNLFFVVSAIILLIIIGSGAMFDLNQACTGNLDIPLLQYLGGIRYLFILGVSVSLTLTLLLAWGILVNAQAIKSLLIWTFSFKLLRKWKVRAAQTGDELILASAELKRKHLGFWMGAFGSTALAWTLKYLEVNILIMAFTPVSGMDHAIILSRMLTLWLIMLLPFTPGASGLAEIAFISLFCMYIPNGLGGAITLMWRLLTYYPYLIFGALYMPVWLKRVYINPSES